jgi:hypothetical protein
LLGNANKGSGSGNTFITNTNTFSGNANEVLAMPLQVWA